jgi:hypothetical protein
VTSGTLVAERVSAQAGSGGGGRGAPGEHVAVQGITRSLHGSMIEAAARKGRNALAGISSPARSYADDHPLVFALTLVGAALSALLLVRERRGT